VFALYLQNNDNTANINFIYLCFTRMVKYLCILQCMYIFHFQENIYSLLPSWFWIQIYGCYSKHYVVMLLFSPRANKTSYFRSIMDVYCIYACWCLQIETRESWKMAYYVGCVICFQDFVNDCIEYFNSQIKISQS
jgi:hypothetical protein